MRRALKEQALSVEVQALMQQATDAYLDADPEEVISILEEVIRIEPTVRKAWSTLALCFSDQGRHDKAIQARIVEATLTPRSPQPWIDLAHDSIELGLREQTLYCFEQAIKSSREKDKRDVLDVMWDRVELLENNGDVKEAVAALKAILKVRQHNSEVLTRLVPILLSMDRVSEAVSLLEKCRDFNMKHFPRPERGEGLRFASYRNSEIATLADLMLMSNEPLNALHTIRQGARWLQGRGHEAWWDEILDDDREFDESRESDAREAAELGRRVDRAPVYEQLDPQLRLRLAHARIRMGDWDEAFRHAEIFFASTDPTDLGDQWEDLLSLYIDNGKFEQALDHLDRMVAIEALQVASLYIKLGVCHRALDDKASAAACFEAVLHSDPDNRNVKVQLAEVYEEEDRREEAIELLNQVYGADKQRGDGEEAEAPPTTARAALELFKSAQKGTQPLSGRRKRTMKTEELQRLEKAREDEALLTLSRLRSRESEVFVPGWWRSDVSLSETAPMYATGDNAAPQDRRYGIDVDVDEEARQHRYKVTAEWLELAKRLIDGYRSMTWLWPRRSGHNKNRGKSGGGGGESSSGRTLRKTAAAAVLARQRAANANDRANDLINRIQDDMLDETAAQHEAGNTAGTSSARKLEIEVSRRVAGGSDGCSHDTLHADIPRHPL